MTQPINEPVGVRQYHGVHVDPKDITAIYHPDDMGWFDMPEARPRARCLAKPGVEGGDRRVVCLVNGDVLYDEKVVAIDRYEGPKYDAVRAEGEARWARVDASRGVAGRG